MIKTIDIQAKEWFDKVNGNSYFSAKVTTDYGTKEEREIKLTFQYGYGSQYEQESLQELVNVGLIKTRSVYDLKQEGIIIRSNIQRNCKKAEVKNFVN